MRWSIAVRLTLTLVLLWALYVAGLYGWLLVGSCALALSDAFLSWCLENLRHAQRDAIAEWKRRNCA